MTRKPLHWLTNVLAELKRRKVYSVCVAYAVTAWIILQIGEVTFEPMGLTDSAMKTLIIVAICGFAVTFALAWLFDLSAKGVTLDPGPSVRSEPTGNTSPAIAVLPFADMSPNQDQAYFCDGIAEEITSALSRIPELKVVARASSFQYRGAAGDIRRIGKELGVGAVLEGSVRKSADHLRVSVELAKVADGYRLWSRTFDESPRNIFEIQTEIAAGVADALLVRFTPQQRARLESRSGMDITAYDFYLRGKSYFRRMSRTSVESALQLFAKAIEVDPSFAAAWACYSECFSFLVMYADSKPEYREKAKSASRRALELAPDLPEAHTARGLALLIGSQFDEADAEFRKALALDATSFSTLFYYGRSCFHQGKLEEAAEYFKKAAELDPSDYHSRILRIQILRGSGRLEQARKESRAALAVIEKQLEWYPDDTSALHLGAAALITLGDEERARRWIERAVAIDPNDSVLRYNVACNLITLGALDDALEHLEAAAKSGTINASWIRNDTDMDPIRTHPRYASLIDQFEKKERTALATDVSAVTAATGSAGS